jgi:hypothetical protein
LTATANSKGGLPLAAQRSRNFTGDNLDATDYQYRGFPGLLARVKAVSADKGKACSLRPIEGDV